MLTFVGVNASPDVSDLPSTLPPPAGTVAGDQLFCLLEINKNDSVGTKYAPGTPTGWTLLSYDNGVQNRFAFFTRKADGTARDTITCTQIATGDADPQLNRPQPVVGGSVVGWRGDLTGVLFHTGNSDSFAYTPLPFSGSLVPLLPTIVLPRSSIVIAAYYAPVAAQGSSDGTYSAGSITVDSNFTIDWFGPRPVAPGSTRAQHVWVHSVRPFSGLIVPELGFTQHETESGLTSEPWWGAAAALLGGRGLTMLV
jgi:hypothetical protein